MPNCLNFYFYRKLYCNHVIPSEIVGSEKRCKNVKFYYNPAGLSVGRKPSLPSTSSRYSLNEGDLKTGDEMLKFYYNRKDFGGNYPMLTSQSELPLLSPETSGGVKFENRLQKR